MTRQIVIDAISFLITKCYFTIGNLVLKQEIPIPMGIDPTPYWASSCAHKFQGHQGS